VRVDDLWIDDDGLDPTSGESLNLTLLRRLRAGPIAEYTDLEATIALASLVQDQFLRYGTDSSQKITDPESREAMRTLLALTNRATAKFEAPFRDLAGFRAYWTSHGGHGSWAARREMIHELFDPLLQELERREDDVLRDELTQPISPRKETGWPAVDLEIAELRRHFHNAQTAQDYRNIGTDVVAVLEAISEVAYEPARHLFDGEVEPPIAQTKNRLARIIEVDAEPEGSAEIVKLAKATVDLAQAVKHNPAGSRNKAGIAADAVIQLANIIRRLQA
jgi:hypothetical protein